MAQVNSNHSHLSGGDDENSPMPVATVSCASCRASPSAQAPGDAQVGRHIQAAREAEKSGDYQKAANEYKEVLKLRPEVAEVWVQRGP